jgi:23S rRNA pseudouridine2605 synthase
MEQAMNSDASDGDLPEESLAGPRLARLNKYLADHGIASRRRCDELIVAGKVSVDGETVTQLGTKIDPQINQVEVDGVVLSPTTTRPRYYLLNKPRGVLCTNERREARMRAIDLIDDPDKGRIYTVGRLDEESTGLILLTNDGEFANRIAHPRYGVTKTYLVKVRGRVESEALEEIRRGVRLAEGRTGRAFIKVLKRTNDFSLVTITLHEGKNREVRRVFAHVGFKVQQLRRTHLGTLSDRSLKEGRWRPLLRTEVEELLSASREGAAPVGDKREDPRTRHFAARVPGPERRGPKHAKWSRDRKRELASTVPAGRRQRGEQRKRLRGKFDRRDRR